MQLARPYLYWGLLAAVGINILISTFSRAEIAYGAFVDVAQFGAGIAGGLFALNRWRPVHAERPLLVKAIAILLEAVVLLVLMIFALRVMDHITKIWAPPYADQWLASVDVALGIEWNAYFTWIHDHPELHQPIRVAYNKINQATAAVVIGLILLGRLDRARFFIEAFVICAAVSILSGAIFPARGSVDFWISDPAAYPNFPTLPGIYYLQSLEYVRQEGPVLIGNGSLEGLVTFPSLHTAIGILMIGACWRSLLALPAIAYCTLMIAGTPVWGGHFFADVIAGGLMATAVMLLLAQSRSFNGLYRRSPRRHRAEAMPRDDVPAE